MEEKEVLALINKAIADHKVEVEIMISDAINGASPKIRVSPNPDWNTDKDKPVYGTLDKIKVKATEGNIYHKGEWIVEGHQANHFIRKGMATFVEVVEKYVKPKQIGKVIGDPSKR